MNKFISAFLLSGAVLTSYASATNVDLGIEPHAGPSRYGTTRQAGHTDDANSQASYVANKTYLELIEQAASSTLSPKDYNFFMGVCRAFSINGSGSTHKFSDYDQFKALYYDVNRCKLPVLARSQENHFRGSDEERMRFSLDYALATVLREAKLADYNKFEGW